MADIPDLSTFAAADTDYVTKMNSDNRAVEAALQSVNADVAAAFNGLGVAIDQDLQRRISSGDETGGVIGSYSLQLQFSDPIVTLGAVNADGVSAAYINGERRTHSGALTTNLNDLGLTAATHDIYIGIDTVGATDMEAVASKTQSNMDVALYLIEATLDGGGNWSIDEVSRVSRSLLFDNTLLQEQLARPIQMKFAIAGSFSSSEQAIFMVPYTHRLSRWGVITTDSAGTMEDSGTAVFDLDITTTGSTVFTTLDTFTSAGFTSGPVCEVQTETPVASGKRVYPADSVYRMTVDLNYPDTATGEDGFAFIEIIPMYNWHSSTLYSIPMS